MTETVGTDKVTESHPRSTASNQATEWNQIDWKKAERVVKNLRYRIFRKAKDQDWKKVRDLIRLMLRSYSNLVVSVKHVTQINPGKNTPGIDGEIAVTSEKRSRLVKELRKYQPWKASPVRRVYIPKSNGKRRPLGIATIRDRIVQTVVKNALEPKFEVEFEAKSHGFRPGRCCQDAIEEIHKALSNCATGKNNYIFDADIKGAYDNMCQNLILDKIGNLPGRELIKQWLKAGYVEWSKLYPTEQGTAQGSVVSPLLANIALDGLQKLLGKGYRYVRYADDFAVMTKSREEIEQAIPRITSWLKERGLELNQDKTRIVHKAEGFNFLGFNVRMFKEKLIIKPQNEKVLNKLKEIRIWLRKNATAKTESVINNLNPILRGWANYYRYVVSKETFSYFDYRMWRMMWNWAKRRHPNKSSDWIYHKYFTPAKHGDRLYADTKNRMGVNQRILLFKMTTVPIIRYIKVKGTASPDDPELKLYWQQRQTGIGKGRFAEGSKFFKVAKTQDWKCTICGNPLFNGEAIDIHHIVPVKDGGSDEVDNLSWLHEACHYNNHGQIAQSIRLELI